MNEGLEILQRIGASMFMPRAGCLMADAHLTAHRYREGLGHVARALHFMEIGDQSCLARLHHLHAKLSLHLHGSRDEAVEASLQQAIGVARRQGAKGWELPAATSLASLWADCGRRSEARDLLAPIYAWFAEGLDTRDLQEAKVLLDSLD